MDIGNNKRVYTQQFIAMFPVLELDDSVDFPLKNPSISWLDIVFLVSSILMHVVDMGFDVNLVVRYLLAGKTTYFIWTTTFIFVPSLINVIISRRMQCQDDQTNSVQNHTESKCIHSMLTRKLYCIVVVAFQLAPVLRYYRILIYTLKAYRFQKQGNRNAQRRYYIKMLKEDQDVALLRVFECFLEAAPQQVLQLTILLKDYHNKINFECNVLAKFTHKKQISFWEDLHIKLIFPFVFIIVIHQVATILSSLASMGWAMASYHRSIRLVQQDKFNIGITGTVLQFLWHFCTTVSRILSLTVAASILPISTAIACILHWIGMSSWIIIDSRGILEFCRNHNHAPHCPPKLKERIYSVILSLIIGVVHVFIYLHAVDGSTFFKHVFFYMICFFENTTATVLWIYMSSSEVKQAWYFNVLIIFCIVPFLVGITAMIVYYCVFHPSIKRSNPVNAPL